MSEWVDVTASDGFTLKSYVARPDGPPKGAIVVVQEIFGINKHIQSVADGFAREGYVAIAPALFDRIQRDVQLDYGPEGKKIAFGEFYPKLNPDKSLLDIAAAYHFVANEDHKGIGVVGFCYGGLMAWLSATRGEDEEMQPSCCVGYYAGGIGKFAAEEPSCPVLLHFGADDSHIGSDQIDAVRNAHPEVEIYIYEGAGHAFTRTPDPDSYNEEAAKLSRQRTLEFLATHIA
jgi:carboxymethylenebutenolidase